MNLIRDLLTKLLETIYLQDFVWVPVLNKPPCDKLPKLAQNRGKLLRVQNNSRRISLPNSKAGPDFAKSWSKLPDTLRLRKTNRVQSQPGVRKSSFFNQKFWFISLQNFLISELTVTNQTDKIIFTHSQKLVIAMTSSGNDFDQSNPAENDKYFEPLVNPPTHESTYLGPMKRLQKALTVLEKKREKGL